MGASITKEVRYEGGSGRKQIVIEGASFGG